MLCPPTRTLIAAGAIVFAAFATPCAASSQAACARPNAPAAVVRAVAPDVPAFAEQQGIVGTVQVIVSLDEASHVVGTRILSSPSALLNAPALQAARASTYRTEIRDCRPVSAEYALAIHFAENRASSLLTAPDGSQSIIVTGSATVIRPAEAVTIVLATASNAETPEAASAQDTALEGALLARFERAGIPRADVVSTARTFAHTGYTVYRTYTVTPRIRSLNEVIAAAGAAGPVAVTSVRFTIRNSEAAYQAALAAATRSAESSARTVADNAHVVLGKLQRATMMPRNGDGSWSASELTYAPGMIPATLPPSAQSPSVPITASVSLTYTIAR